MSRRSTRLSSDTMAVPSPTASSSALPRRASTRSSGTTGTSLDALPTTTASRAAGKRAGREMRFSQVLAAEEDEGVGDASAFPHEPVRPESPPPVRGKGKQKGSETGSSSAAEGGETKRKRTDSGTIKVGKEVERKTSASRKANGAPKAPRQTDGEDWFTREAPAAMAPEVVLNRTVYAALPDTGETPIIARNKLFREGGVGSSSGPSSSSLGVGGSSSASLGRGAPPIRRGRTSMDLKRSRRTSTSFKDGSAAYPHDSVPDSALFNHCPVQTDERAGAAPHDLTDVQRMRFLAGCALKRGMDAAVKGKRAPLLDQVREAALKHAMEAAVGKKGKEKKECEARVAELKAPRECDAAETKAALGKKDKEALVRVAPMLGEALRQTLDDLMQGNVDIDWHKRPKSNTAPGQQTHPQNLVNQTTHARLDGIVQAMRSEAAAWQEEVVSLEAYEAETKAMLASARSRATPSSSAAEEDVTAPPGDGSWGLEDLSEAAKKQLEDARATLAAEAPWAVGAGGSKADAAVRAANAADVAAGLADAKAYEGTELDPRWGQIEYNADQLRHRTHTYAQLSGVAERYIKAVSARAAEALANQGRLTQPAGPSSSGAGASTAEASGSASTQNAQSRNDVEALLGGARKRPVPTALPVDEAQDATLDAGNETQGDLLMALVAANSRR